MLFPIKLIFAIVSILISTVFFVVKASVLILVIATVSAGLFVTTRLFGWVA